MPLAGDKNAVVTHTVKKLQTSRNLKTHFRLIEIAKNCEESVFQKNDEYLKFKGQKNLSTWDIEVFLSRLSHLDYFEEKIYWNKRALEEKVGDKEQRYVFFYNLVCIYENLGEHELVLEYGQKPMEWLDSFKEKLGLFPIYYLLNCLVTSTRQLKRFKESIVYEKERLKLIIKTYNSGESVYEDKTPIKNDDVLHCYRSLIDSQIRCKHFNDALKSFKKIKLYKLDSMDPDDVDESMRQFDPTVEIPYDRCNLLTIIGDLCKLKSQAFHGLGDKENDSLWSSLAIDICATLQEVTRSIEKNDGSPGQLDLETVSWQNSFTTQLVKTLLTVAEIDPTERCDLFNQAMCYLLYESKHASFYISKLVQDDFMNFETLIPFIEHFIKRCTKDDLTKIKERLDHVKYQQKIHTNFSLENQRKKMVTYQNSLLIMKHFNGLP